MVHCAGNRCRFLYIFTFCVLDIVLTTVLFAHGTDYKFYFLVSTYFYHFPTSMFELWIFSAVRVCLTFGALLGLLCNNDQSAVARVNCTKIPILVLSAAMWMYPIIKLLAYSEHVRSLSEPWFWCLFSWSIFSAMFFYVNWHQLGKAEEARVGTPPTNKEEDRRDLLDGNTADVEDTENDASSLSPKEPKMPTVGRLVAYSKPDIKLILVAIIFMVISSIAQIFTPYYTGQVIQGIAIDRNEAKFVRAIIFMAIFSTASAIAAGIRGGFFKVAMVRLNIRIRNHLFSSMLSQEIGFFDSIRTGDLTSRLTSDTSTMSDALSLNTNIFLRSLIKAIGVCAFMFTLSWRLSLVTVIGLPIIMGVSKAYGSYYQTLSKKVQDSLAKANEVAEETCSSMRTVRSFANEPVETARYADKLVVTHKLKVKEAFAYAGYVWSNELFELMLVTATLYYGGHLVVNNLMSGGDLVSFILYQIELGSALESISDVYTGLMQAIGASQKVFEFIDRKPLVKPEGGSVHPNTLEGRIEFRNVSFAYPTRPDSLVLKNVSFSVDPGEVVALVGPSGGGKSSCINLLEHFYETLEGAVLIDNVSINDYDHKYLHTKIALVGQEPVLYATSVKENIAYGLDLWNEELVEKAARLANAHEFISDMKEKYNTNTGEKGLQLSGGQKQRLAIARAVIRNPTILLLDEATSALDSESEYLVQEALYKNLRGRTVIIIAHRLSTVEKATRIIVIEKGCVVEQGSHVQLLSRGGLYAKLVQRQLLGFDVGFSDHVTKPPIEVISSAGSFKSFDSLTEDSVSGGTPTPYGSW